MKKKGGPIEKNKFFEIMRFCIGGGMGLGVYYVALYVLTEFANLWYPISAIIGSIFNYGISFLFQKYWTFKNKDSAMIPKQVTFYFLMSVSLTFANSILLYLLVEYANLKYLIAQVIITVILSVISYLVTKRIFKH